MIKKILLLSLLFVLLPLNLSASTDALVDFSESSIEEIQEYVDDGYLTYEIITQTYLDRIAEYGDMYESIITVNPNALEEARALDEIYRNEGRISMLHGMPLLIKDNIDVKGLPTTAGAKGLLDNIALEDADIVSHLRDAGAIFIAKANMDEFAFHGAMSRSMFGLVKNGYNLGISAYGSSGGTASGIASNLAVAGLGTDTGVSIRVPSAANNLYGLRPSHELISSQGIIQFDSSRDTAGPMTKYASDAQIMFDIITNGHTDNHVALNQLRIGIVRSQMNQSPYFIRAMIEEKINLLKDAGVTFVDVPEPSIEYQFNSNNFCYEFNQYIKGTQGPITSLSGLIATGNFSQYITSYVGNYCDKDFTQTPSYQTYLELKQRNINATQAFYDKYQIQGIIYPTITEPLKALSPTLANSVASYSYMVAPATGFPSINIPVGMHQGLPYGMDITGLQYYDDTLLDVAVYLDDIQTSYTLPDISPSLYTPIAQIETLMKITKSTETHDTYLSIIEDTQAFLDHYGDYANKAAVADMLIDRFDNNEELIEQINLQIRQQKQLRNRIIGSSLTVVVLVGVLIVKKNKKKKRRRRKKL